MGIKSGVNQKSLDAKNRKAKALLESKLKEEKEKEDLKWVDNDKQVRAMEERKRIAEEKLKLQKEKKEEKKKLEEEELKKFNVKQKDIKSPKCRTTQAKIQLIRQKVLDDVVKKHAEAEKSNYIDEDKITENINHARRAEAYQRLLNNEEIIQASGINAALAELSTFTSGKGAKTNSIIKNRISYKEYCEKEYPKLKAEFPTFKRSQILEKIHKNWVKSYQNADFDK